MVGTGSRSIWNPAIVRRALGDAFRKLHPRTMARNPVMFVVEVGSVLTTCRLIQDVVAGRGGLGFELQITVWLWFTVLFANFAEAMAEGRGKAQADTLRQGARPRRSRIASARAARSRSCPRRRCARATSSGSRPARSSRPTARSSRASPRSTRARSPASRRRSSASPAAIARRSPAARGSSPTGFESGSPPNPGETFLDRMIALVEGAERQKTPNEIALNILLAGLTIVFLLAVRHAAAVRDLLGRAAVAVRAGRAAGLPDPDDDRRPALGDRHRRHGPPGPAQRARDVRPRGRSGRRRPHAAARQDRHDHARQPPGDRVPAAARRQRRGAGRCRAARVARRRDARRALDRGAGQGEVRPARPRAVAAARGVRAVHRADPHVRRRPRCGRRRSAARALPWTSREIRKGAAEAIEQWVGRMAARRRRAAGDRRAHRARRRHAARRRRRTPARSA